MIEAFLVVFGLIVFYFTIYILNHRTPVPEGCEDLKVSTEKCGSCNNAGCSVKIDLKAIKKKEGIK